MKNVKKIFLLFIASFALSSCDKGFEELNTNPNAPLSVPSELLMSDVIFIAMNSSYSTFVGGDMGECWAQHWGKVQYNDEERYQPRSSVIQDLVWKNYYEDVISDAKTIEKLSITEKNKAMQAVGLILQSYGYLYLTDVFGSIPFTEAMKAEEGIFSPKYDSQETVYTGVLTMLDQANDLLSKLDDDDAISASSDLLYGGDASRWQKFANSLKFRALMRISGKKDVKAELTELLTRPMFESSTDEAKLIYLSAAPSANPMFENIVFNVRGEFKLNEKLVNMLADLSDPRLPVYAQPNKKGEYRGKPAGIEDLPSPLYNYDNVSAVGTLYLEPTAPGYFLSYTQLQFLMAEAAQRGLIAGDAAMYYNNAVTASFEANGVGADAADYLAQATVAYDGSLQRIGEQEWVALFCQGVEAWTEWRRTGFPALTPAIEGVINQIPSRYTYPSIEQSVNKANYAAAVAQQGEDKLTTKVWWMK